MKKIQPTLLLALILLLFPAFTYAKDAAKKKEQLSFTPVKLSGENITTELQNDGLMKILNHLQGEDFFVLNKTISATDNLTNDSCLKKNCTSDLAGLTPDGIVILISVISEEVKIGERRVSTYMTEDITEKRYTIQVTTVDIHKSEYELDFQKTFTDTGLIIKEADIIGESIREHYIKRKTIIQPVEKKIEKKPEEKKQEEKGKPFIFYETGSATFNLSMLYPFGRFREIADFGIGAEAVLNGRSPIFPYITINPGISIFGIYSSNENINSEFLILPELTLGYNFTIIKELGISPVLGLGYSFMVIDGSENSTDESRTKIYYNPEFKAGIEAAYSLTTDYSIFSSISYRCIAEHDSLLTFSTINIGIRMKL